VIGATWVVRLCNQWEDVAAVHYILDLSNISCIVEKRADVEKFVGRHV